jgi:hypothetical protein
MFRISYKDVIEINRLNKLAFAQPSDIDSIWDIYINIFSSPPAGSKKCGQCVREMFSRINEVLESEKSQPLWDEWFSNGGEIKETKKKDGRKSKL